MAGLGRRTHYRKHLTDSIIYDMPEPEENEKIAKIVATRGGNQFDIILPKESPDENTTTVEQGPHLAILPTKFNKLVWIKRNEFVIVETAHDDDAGVVTEESRSNDGTVASEDTGGIRYIISHILYKDQVKHLQSKGLWPTKDAEFATEKIGLCSNTREETNESTDDSAASKQDDGIVYDMGYEGDELLVNTNRLSALKVDDSSDSDSSEGN